MLKQPIYPVYTSCACNRTPNVVDWGRNNLISYGACNAVVIWNPKANNNAGNIEQTLSHHTDRVNAVRWIPNAQNHETELVSGSTDGKAILWEWKSDGYQLRNVLTGHLGGVTVVDGVHVGNVLYIFTASVDASVKIWNRTDGGEISCLQTLKFDVGMCTALRVCNLPNEEHTPILACATTDCKINLFVESATPENGAIERNFQKVNKLSGHEGWVRGMDFAVNDNGEVFLASCAQDTYIRIWKFVKFTGDQGALQKPISSLGPTEEIKTAEELLTFKLCSGVESVYSVALESVLAGHEGWVYGVQWQPQYNGSQSKQLLSSSMDKTMILWTPDKETGIWMDSVRVGEVGGNTLGFYGSIFSPDGLSILGHGYLGSFHMWSFSETKSLWEPQVVVGGHYNEVVDLAWAPEGQYMLTLSTDQTTRLHSPWNRSTLEKMTWHEIARPQVHGYDMSCIAVCGKYRFASGAEEKIIRIFEAPNNFVENFQSISKLDMGANCQHTPKATIPKGASVPSLGLSNKAVYESDIQDVKKTKRKDEYPDSSYFTALKLEEPPTEENLMQNTLWPEVQKLYGHGFEIFALTASHDGALLASACKATKLEHANIFIWNTRTWQQIQTLHSHSLTITQMAFAPNNRSLLSVSRDRRWSIFERVEDSDRLELVACTDKKSGIHTRIIWCCAWSPDSKYFATGSRDGKVVVWGGGVAVPEVSSDDEEDTERLNHPSSTLGKYGVAGECLEMKNESITAIAFAPRVFTVADGEFYVIACGFDSGVIRLYVWTPTTWREFACLDGQLAHHKTVRRLMFRPGQENNGVMQLASCGSDHITRLYELDVTGLLP